MEKDYLRGASRLQIYGEEKLRPNEVLLLNLKRIRETFNTSEISRKDLPVYYPGAGWDVTFPLAMTDARNFIFVDYLYHTEMEDFATQDKGIPDEIKELGGEILSETIEGIMGSGGRKTIKFLLEGVERKITLYAEDATKFEPEELKNGASFIIIKRPTPASRGRNYEEVPGDVDRPENMAKIYKALAVGGFFMRDPNVILPLSIFGFKEILKKEDEEFPLYQKVKEEPEIEKLLRFDRDLQISEAKRYGTWIDRVDESTIDSYRESVKKLRELFEKLDSEKQKEILPSLYYIFDPDEEREEVILLQLVQFGLENKDKALEYLESTFQFALRYFPELSYIES